MSDIKSSFDIEGHINDLIRHPDEDISAYLTDVVLNVNILSTKAIMHCHMLSFDGNDRPREDELAIFLSNAIIDYAIPRSQIKDAQILDLKENTTRHVSALKKKAKTLFVSFEKTGEGGEMLLYLLAQHILKIPQVLCKMSLKTSTEVHFHGIDGLHIKYDKEQNKLALYWGESKLYSDIGQGITACLDSIKPYLIDSSKDRNNRDLQLFRDNLDLIDSELEERLLNYLNPDHPDFNKMQFRGICLIGFDDNRYPSKPNQKNSNLLKTEIESSITTWSKKLGNKILLESPLETFNIDIFLIPLQSVQNFRDAFLNEVKNA